MFISKEDWYGMAAGLLGGIMFGLMAVYAMGGF